MALLFGADTLLLNLLISLLASVGPIPTRERLSAVLGGQWGWESTYGNKLFAAMMEMDIPPLVHRPAKPRAQKKGRGGQEGREKPANKRKKVELVREIPEEMQFTFEVSGYST